MSPLGHELFKVERITLTHRHEICSLELLTLFLPDFALSSSIFDKYVVKTENILLKCLCDGLVLFLGRRATGGTISSDNWKLNSPIGVKQCDSKLSWDEWMLKKAMLQVQQLQRAKESKLKDEIRKLNDEEEKQSRKEHAERKRTQWLKEKKFQEAKQRQASEAQKEYEVLKVSTFIQGDPSGRSSDLK